MESIKQGVNQSMTLHLDFDTSILENFQLSFFQQGTEIITKGPSDCETDGMAIHTELTQAETFKFSPQRFAVSLRGKYTDGGTVIIENIPFVVHRSSYSEVI